MQQSWLIALKVSCLYSRLNLAPAQINLFSYCQVQILEMPSKTSVCTLKPEADAKPGMPMCLELWQVRPSARQPRPVSHACQL